MVTQKEVEFAESLININYIWKILDMSLINGEVNLILTCTKICVIPDMATQASGAAQGNPPEIRASRDGTLSITDIKLYAPVITTPTQHNNKLLQQLKTGY